MFNTKTDENMEGSATAYNNLAPFYHLIFQDWPAAMRRQASIVSRLLPAPQEAGPVLDCACDIGTQALGLAALGYEMEGTDISHGEVERARREAVNMGLDASFRVDDMRTLTTSPAGRYGAVLCMDNSLPHLGSDEQISAALKTMRSRLRRDGFLLISLRDYEKLMVEKSSIMAPSFFQEGQYRRFVHQVWDWTGERSYRFHQYLTFENADGWQAHHVTGTYRAVTPAEVVTLTEKAGFKAIRLLSPEESGYYQPIIQATA